MKHYHYSLSTIALFYYQGLQHPWVVKLLKKEGQRDRVAKKQIKKKKDIMNKRNHESIFPYEPHM